MPSLLTTPPARLTAPGLASLTLQLSTLGHCVALRWECFSEHSEQAVRAEVERALEQELEELVTEDNAIAIWLLSLAVLIFTAVLTLLVMLVLIQLRDR